MRNQKKGVALLWALVVIIVMLVIAGSLAGLIIKEMRMSLNTNLSEQAYAAARSGMDAARDLGCAQKKTYETAALSSTDNVRYEISIDSNGDPNGCDISSTGTVGSDPSTQISRKLKQVSTAMLNKDKIAVFPPDYKTGSIKYITSGTGSFNAFTDTLASGVNGTERNGKFLFQFDLSRPNPDYVSYQDQSTPFGIGYVNSLGILEKNLEVGLIKHGSPTDVWGYIETRPDKNNVTAESWIQLKSQPQNTRIQVFYDGGTNATVKFLDIANPANPICIGTGTVTTPSAFRFNTYIVESIEYPFYNTNNTVFKGFDSGNPTLRLPPGGRGLDVTYIIDSGSHAAGRSFILNAASSSF